MTDAALSKYEFENVIEEHNDTRRKWMMKDKILHFVSGSILQNRDQKSSNFQLSILFERQ